MSEHRVSWWRVAACALSIVAGDATTARGQTVAEYTQRADSLTRMWKAGANTAKNESIREAILPSDTLRVGNFVIITDSAHAELARGAAARLSPSLDSAYGAFAARLRTHTFVLRSRTQQRGETAAIESGVLDEQGTIRFSSRDFATVNGLAVSWNGKAAEAITQDLPPEVRRWLDQSIPVERLTQKDLERDRIELVLAGSQAAHDCATGSTPRCLQALGLTPVADPAFALFNEDQRRDMIERNATRFRRSDPGQYTRCTIGHVQAMCDSIVGSIPLDAIPSPVPPTVRRSLVRYALITGGPGAFDRLASAEGTISERLATVSKMPTDSLVQRWQQALVDSRATSTAIDFETATSAVLWAAACCALALRSSRWR